MRRQDIMNDLGLKPSQEFNLPKFWEAAEKHEKKERQKRSVADVLKMRYSLLTGRKILSFREMAKILGVSCACASKLVARALDEMREPDVMAQYITQVQNAYWVITALTPKESPIASFRFTSVNRMPNAKRIGISTGIDHTTTFILDNISKQLWESLQFKYLGEFNEEEDTRE